MTLATVSCCSMTTAVFTACSDNDDNKNSTPPSKETVEYTVIFYGQGGGDLDQQIMENVNQFYLADASSYNKVNVVGLYKFSTAENLEERSMPAELAAKYGSKTYRFVCSSKVEDPEAWMDISSS